MAMCPTSRQSHARAAASCPHHSAPWQGSAQVTVQGPPTARATKLAPLFACCAPHLSGPRRGLLP
eukprot:15256457-Alexandrium_andersonii.AAC.1